VTTGIGDRYVKTAAIKEAVKGQELTVLTALGIDWSPGARKHIRCPYPDHAGDADWRWDERKRWAFCTCIGKRAGEKRSHSIFDVVALKEGIDFEAAKIRVAQIIDRSDLIKTKGDGERHQATDPESLLKPRPDNRNDDLAWNYLGYRLGVHPDRVPRPRTRVVGLKALGYFDPPPQGKKTAKPTPVTTTPCAVFEQVERDGKIHAHRIYLAEGGLGKADLGLDASGKARDPKKSAKKSEDDYTSGRSVLWGDPATATVAIICEGVETAAAIALAFQAEIEAGEIQVVSCINAAGIENFKPWPETKEVIVAADRDEAADGGHAPSRRGEHAAREFGIRHHPDFAGEAALPVSIALPGAPGESVDWLDILRRAGIGAVRAGVMGASPFTPTQDEIADQGRARDQAAEANRVTETYPLPHLQRMRLAYRATDDGRIWVHKFEGFNKERGERWTPIASPFGIPARLRHADQGDAYGLRCLVQDMAGKPRAVDFERAGLARMGASEIRSALFAAGLRTGADGEIIAVQCLKAADPEREIVVVRYPGWQEVVGLPDPVFICPNGDMIGAPADLALELAASGRMAPNVAVAGTLEGWREGIEAAFFCDDCPHWVLGIAAGFVGTLVSLLGLDTCGINLSGLSSSGKTTGQRLAVSAWSTPDIRRRGLAQSARASDNAVEALAQRATGTVLSLDELAHGDGKVTERVIYMIAGGRGKERMKPDALIREGYSWSTFAILSSECSLQEKIRAGGGEWRAGMAVRIVDIDVTGINRNVGSETFRVINKIEHHYGHAGPAFVDAMISQGLHRQAAALRKRVDAGAQEIAGADADGAKLRAAIPFALLLIAGEMAKAFGIIPNCSATVRDAVMWAWGRFQQSSDGLALEPEAQVVVNLRRWTAERWNVTIKSVEEKGGVNNRETIAWYDEIAIYVPKDRIREAAGNVLKESHIGAMLDRRGLLAQRTESDRFCVRWVPKVGKVTCYALRRSEFGRSDAVVDPEETLTVRRGGVDD
jgi:hypothetical protein